MNTNPAVTPECPYQAFRDVARAYGIPALAKATGMKQGTLYNKADADPEGHNQPTLRDVISVTQITGNMLILDSLDRMFGRVAYELPSVDVSDKALMELLCRVGSENGQMHQALLRGLEDGKFSMAEARLVRAEAYDVITAVMAFVERVDGLVDD